VIIMNNIDRMSKIYVAGHRGMVGSAIVRALEETVPINVNIAEHVFSEFHYIWNPEKGTVLLQKRLWKSVKIL